MSQLLWNTAGGSRKVSGASPPVWSGVFVMRSMSGCVVKVKGRRRGSSSFIIRLPAPSRPGGAERSVIFPLVLGDHQEAPAGGRRSRRGGV